MIYIYISIFCFQIYSIIFEYIIMYKCIDNYSIMYFAAYYLCFYSWRIEIYNFLFG